MQSKPISRQQNITDENGLTRIIRITFQVMGAIQKQTRSSLFPVRQIADRVGTHRLISLIQVFSVLLGTIIRCGPALNESNIQPRINLSRTVDVEHVLEVSKQRNGLQGLAQALRWTQITNQS